ncbi:MAG: LPS assembly lipoprotein LptE [Myxococcales bacterium]|jgi:hypothetical protein|nr:LPS assembly lipoprotein LptE [Myxococcales bacterium]
MATHHHHSSKTSPSMMNRQNHSSKSSAWVSLVLVGLSLLIFFSGCGYRFTPEGGELPGGARAVAVPMFENDTAEPGIGAWFTEALRVEVGRTGREGGAASEARIVGKILEVRDPTAIYTANPQGGLQRTSARVEAVVELRFLRGDEQLRRVMVRGGEDYLIAPSQTGSLAVLQDDANRRLALRRLAERLMRDGFEQMQTF